jgi:hypothetical protein
MQTEWAGPEMQLQLHGLLVASWQILCAPLPKVELLGMQKVKDSKPTACLRRSSLSLFFVHFQRGLARTVRFERHC